MNKSKKMHIILIHQAFASLEEPGGTRHHEFARFLAKQGHQVSIIASPVSYLTGEIHNRERIEEGLGGLIKIYRTYTYSALHKSFVHRVFSFFSFMVSSFIKSVSIKNVDLVWGTTPPIFQSVTAWLISKLKGIPFLLEVRDLWPEFAIAVGVLKNPFLIKISFWLERFLYHHADQIVVNSPGFIELVREKGGREVSLIPNGADIELFNNVDNSETRKTLGWTDQFIVLYAGAHGMSNDLGVVLQAAQLLKDEKTVHLVLLGDGKEKSALILEAKKIGLSNVTFSDPVPKNRVAELLIAADACIAILKPIDMYKTTYPNKVFDYMAAKKPVILAIDGVIRKVVESAGCGIFCTPGDPIALADGIKYFYKNPEIAVNMGLKGYDFLKTNFSREKFASDLLNIMDGMVK
jgi:glycosyltransferase involved in cell wall biosynthesis